METLPGKLRGKHFLTRFSSKNCLNTEHNYALKYIMKHHANRCLGLGSGPTQAILSQA